MVTDQNRKWALRAFKKTYPCELNEEMLKEKIEIYHDLSLVPMKYNGLVDSICSYTVLEHIKNLNEMFKLSFELLASDGIAFHEVDVTDHTYHVFDQYSFLKWIWEV